MRLFRVVVYVLVIGALTGCDKGFDRAADFSSEENYKTRITKAASEATQLEIAAFDWAVSQHTIESLKAKYPGKSFREIGVGEIEREIQLQQKAIPELEALVPHYDKMLSELFKVQVEVTDARPSKNFFGDQFDIFATVTNGSSLDFSSLLWVAELYIDGGAEPVAKATLPDNYDQEGGLRSGQVKRRKFNPETFFSKNWATLAVRNAESRKVVLTIDNGSDFNSVSILKGAPYRELRERREILALAQQHLAALKP